MKNEYADCIRCPVRIDGGRCFSHWCQDNGCADEGDDEYDEKARAAMEREIHDEIDAMRALADWNMGLGDAAPVDWFGSEEPF